MFFGLIALVILLNQGNLFASIGFPGGVNGYVLRVPVGTQAIGMGGAHTAVADGIFSAFWNPGSINYVRRSGVSVATMALWNGVVHNDFGFLLKGKVLAFSARFSQFIVDDIQEYDSMEGELGKFSQSIEIMDVAMGAKLFKKVSLGISLRGFHEFFYQKNNWGYAFNFGIYGIAPRHFCYGLAVQNVFARRLDSQLKDDNILPSYQAGISWNYKDLMTLSSDMIILPHGYLIGAAGVNYHFSHSISLRMGFSGLDFRSGLGLRLGNLNIDYAIIKSDVNLFHSVEISFLK